MTDTNLIETLKSQAQDALISINSLKAEMNGQVRTLDEKAVQVQGELTRFGNEFADTKAKQVEMAQGFAKNTGTVQALEAELLDIKRKMALPQFGTVKDRDESLYRDFVEHTKSLHISRGGDSDRNDYKAENYNFDSYKLAIDAIERRANTKSKIQGGQELAQNLWTAGEIKSINEFSFGGAGGWFTRPEISRLVLSCFQEPTELASLATQLPMSKGEITFLIEGDIPNRASWADRNACGFETPATKDRFGELILKAHELRYAECISPSFLEDADINIQSWLATRTSKSFRRTINDAIITGDGDKKPVGILNAKAGIKACEVSSGTAAGVIGWDDLIALKYDMDEEYHSGAEFWMNSKTYGALLTQKDSQGRPIMFTDIAKGGARSIDMSPVRIIRQMPDIAAGTTPVGFVNFKETYLIGNRKNVTFQRDDFSAGFCSLFKWSARVGGGIACKNASRLLKTK